jgi:prepilin-type N-terminal cleavage/methylation domain-containing protein
MRAALNENRRHPRPHRANRAFTLIEMIIVITIIVILVVVFAMVILPKLLDAKKKDTQSTLEKLGQSWNNVSASNLGLYNPSLYSGRVTDGFAVAAGIRGADSYSKLSPMQRAKLLCAILAPGQEGWNKTWKPVNGKTPDFNPPIAEENSKSMRAADDDTFEYLKDGWGRPFSYDFSNKTTAEGQLPGLRLISGGRDGDLSTKDDNIYWTDKGVTVGE